MGIFKAYDVRGIVPRELTRDVAFRIGKAAVRVLRAKTVCVGRDMRLSGPEMSDALIKGIIAAGAVPTDIGECSTPMNYFATGKYGFGAGIMVTASHNPAEYNGFKMSRENAIPVSYDTGLAEMEKLVAADGETEPRGEVKCSKKDVLADYKKHVLSFVRSIKKMKIVVDNGNGMVGKFFPAIMKDLDCEVVPFFFEPDGSFPNHEPNPLKPENLQTLIAAVKKEKAQLGVAFDGDGDRCVFVDEAGKPVSADMITLLLAQDFLKAEPGATFVYDLRSSAVVKEEIEKLGGKALESRVGHSYIKAVMREHKSAFGGELSGHYYFRDNYYADSGEIAMLKVLNILSESGRKLGELIKPFQRFFATGEVNFEVEDPDGRIAALAKEFSGAQIYYLDGISVKLADWWFNVRKSNTEPILRLNLEARTRKGMEDGRRKVEKIIKE